MEQNGGDTLDPVDKQLFHCKIKDIHCSHADPRMNKEIGYEYCSGEYCGD